MRTLSICILILFSSFGVNAQETAVCIPANALYVFSLHFGQLDAKCNGINYTRYLESFTRKSSRKPWDYSESNEESCVITEISTLMQDPASYGLATDKNIYYYRSSLNGISGNVYLFNLKDPALFISKLRTECRIPGKIQIRETADETLFISDGISVVIRGKVAAIFDKDYQYFRAEENTVSYDPEYADSIFLAEKFNDNLRADSILYRALNGEKEPDTESILNKAGDLSDTGIIFRARERMKSRQNEALNKKFNQLQDLLLSLVRPQPEALTSHRNFSKLMSEKHDAFVFVNSLSGFGGTSINPFFRANHYAFGSAAENAAGNESGRKMLSSELSAFYSIDFENGKAVVRMTNTYNEKVFPYYKRAYDVKQDKKLFKYIEGRELLGYMSVAVSGKELGKFYEDLYFEMINSTPKRESENDIFSGMQLVWALVDKEMLFNTLDGRMILACTGFTDVKISYTDYRYDDDFNKTEVQEERVVKQARMVLAASVGNYENARKLFSIISGFKIFTRVRENVLMMSGGRNMPFNLYIALNKDALIISNDGNVVLNFPDGLPSKDRISSSVRKTMRSHNMNFHISSSGILSGIQNAWLKDAEELPFFSRLMTGLGDLEMSDSKPGRDSYTSTAVIHLKDSNSNSLFQLLNMMQPGYGTR